MLRSERVARSLAVMETLTDPQVSDLLNRINAAYMAGVNYRPRHRGAAPQMIDTPLPRINEVSRADWRKPCAKGHPGCAQWAPGNYAAYCAKHKAA